MPSAAQLVQTLSLATGAPLASVVDLDRRLVKARLRAIGGRGLNAAQVTPLEAARLLTAVLANPQANRAAEAVLRYADTKVDRSRSSEALLAGIGIEDLARLKPSHGFVDGLTSLIASASSGSLAGLIDRLGAAPLPHIEIMALTRVTLGRIRISGMAHGLTASLEYQPKTSGRAAMRAEAGDLEQSRRVTERTIVAVASLFAQQEEPT